MDDEAFLEEIARSGAAPERLVAIARRAVAWLAIADAPRNGSSLLLSDTDGIFIGHWHGGAAFGFWTDGTEIETGRMVQRHPTAWMPLPHPPAASPA